MLMQKAVRFPGDSVAESISIMWLYMNPKMFIWQSPARKPLRLA
jgi:hypothetical protein